MATTPQPNTISSATYKERARALAAQKNHRSAAVAYALAVRSEPRGDAGLFLAIQLKKAGETEMAARAYRAFLKARPDHFDGWTSFGVMMKDAQLFEDAVIAFRRALAIRPHDIPTRNALVTSLWQLGREEEALREGRTNLQMKDRKAHNRFAASRFAERGLGDRQVRFDAGRRGANIIAFSLWGDNPAYVTGAIVNARIAQYIYVGWTPRFYCDTSVPADARAELARLGAQVVLLDDPLLARIRPMWRFLVADDPDVDFFVCRDADSRLNVQEFLAVDEWVRSGKRFHVMRDHVYHMELVLAGMWGGTAGVLPSVQDWLLETQDYHDDRFGDQAFLMDMVWPLIKPDLMTHDSCYGFPDGRDFPGEYRLPGQIHVGGAVKTMPHWQTG
ncbi:UDP-N-acetylglucosamine-peptide N-acetylglucosaminyltransferase [Pseudooceanicola aestuarii]|uniref:UDP-N-acetylglucosamine-peptide N-acetylglucosaminyltransferase n=1 Tax=Pseudooceanicola aestuarii TaxID=2697319 RepID=UPI0013D121E8|nr:UDP-N-acetylglucosamine-peptide N-acetylglucosaminyltransferase [Pseudooceanicola aestuarii]